MKIDSLFTYSLFLAALWAATLLCATSIRALNPNKAVTQYVHNVWTSNDGLPQDSVNAIAQTPDGYLWLATQEGAARFDGLRFSVFDASNIDGFGSFVYTLHVDRAGTLWLGCVNLFSYSDRKFVRYSTADGLPDIAIKHISEDADGNFWFGAASSDRIFGGRGLIRFADKRATVLTTANGLSSNQVYDTLTDSRGNLWIGTGDGLNLYKNGEFKVYRISDGLSGNLIRTVYEDRAGNIWLGTSSGLNRFSGGKFVSYTTANGLSNDSINTVYEDADGILWVGTDRGLNRIVNGRIQSVTDIDALSNDGIFSIYEDRERSLWIGTHNNGLHRLRDAKFTTYGAPEGLRGDSLQSIYQDSSGRMWFGTSDGGLNVLENNQFRTFSRRDGLLGDRVRAICEDRAGNMWFGSELGLNKFKDEKFTTFTTADGLPSSNIRSMYEDENGVLWLGTTAGLSLFAEGKFKNFGKAEGLLGNSVNFIHRAADGQIYVAGDEGLSVFQNNKLVAVRAGFPDEFNAQSISEDANRTLWITSWGQGLNRLKDGKLTTYTTKNGLYDNTAWSILDDGNGNLWMGCNRGVFRVSKQELNDFADGKISRVNSIVYGAANGMRKRETNAGSPSALHLKDGRLWFATTAGAVVINANDVISNHVAPPIVIEKLVADEQTLGADGEKFELETGTKNVEFHYVGLSFVAPERVRYKYKLEGFDNEWVDAGTRRAAYYTNLAPGKYLFRVIAANNDDVWNEQGASLEFRVLAPFWRTWWFFGFSALALMTVIYALFRWRISRLERANQLQRAFSRQLIESQESERKRIAAELHDNLGQRLIIIKNWASLGLKFSGADAPAREQLEEISTTALQAIGEVREIIYDLRPVQIETSGLSSTIKFTVEQIAASSGINFTVECDDLSEVFSPEDEVIVYRIVQECVSNAVKHSDAENVSVTIKRDAGAVKIKIADEGKGFVPGSPPDAGKRCGFGLNGLNERAKMLGGFVQIQSITGKGTTIFIEVQAHSK